jgi:Protein of unknown function (DUF2939)
MMVIMENNATEGKEAQQKYPRWIIGSGIVLFFLVGAAYAWTSTPSYSLYRIKRALEAHDYATFSRYVDVDSVLDHALDEFGDNEPRKAEEPPRRGSLDKLLRRGLANLFSGQAREVAKAGLSIAVEQTVKDQDRQLPRIPATAVVAALWLGQTEGALAIFPVKMKRGQRIEVRARRTPEGVWRVVAVSNLRAFLPALQKRVGREPFDNDESGNE